MIPAPPPLIFGRPIHRIHCVGLGGMGVGPLAAYLVQRGFRVSGEDDALAGEMREMLAGAGVCCGPLAGDAELVVHSSAVARQHPTCAAAVARGLPLVRRGELLAEVARDRRLVAVCGSHGKTTTTALLITVLRAAGFPAGYVLGGRFADATPPARAGSSDWLVAEIDESDGTIADFSPELTVATNLDWDHADHYRRPEDLAAAFAALFGRTRGAVLCNDTCALSTRVAADLRATPAGVGRPEFATFGRAGDFRGAVAEEAGEHMTLRLGGRFQAPVVVVRARGEFNAANATAALAAASLMGVAWDRHCLETFPGVCRRQAELAAAGGVTVIEDYAHHPAEIRVLLASLRGRVAPGRRLLAVFQPHRFSRTAQFKAELAAALASADVVYLLDVYPAGETPLAGGTSADVYAELKLRAPGVSVLYYPGRDGEFCGVLSRAAGRGDVVAFVGAGDIEHRAREWLIRHAEETARAARWDEIEAALRPRMAAATRLRREEPLATRTTLRVGGAARLYAEPASVADLQILRREAAARDLAFLLLGRGSNLIVPDEGVDGVVVALTHRDWATFEPHDDGRVWVGAGLRLKNLCGLAAQAGLPGFEFLEGIPGTIGGALRMNAGAMGGWFFDLVDEVQLMGPDGAVNTVPRKSLHVGYRHCAELAQTIALGALLHPAAMAGRQSAADDIGRQIDTYRRKRHETQPREPSAGCIFRNPPGNSAGRLIDECGLKGERVGDAEVSLVHANFIVNRGRATGADVIALVRRVRAEVMRLRQVDLQPEVLLYGRNWEEVL